MSVDYILKGGIVIDGTAPGTEPKRADVAVEKSRIRAVGDLSRIDADRIIDISGLVVCPGFIDTHAHSEFMLLADGRAEGKILQGITTEVNGNCGMSAAPLTGAAVEQRLKELEALDIRERWSTFDEYFALLEKRKTAVNFATLVGHGNVRASAVGYADTIPGKEGTRKMLEMITEAMQQGARGLSTGLIYPPGIYSGTGELVACAREASKQGGLYATHMRSEGDELLESIDEVIRIARESGTHAHISHLKTSGEENWNKIGSVFEKIEAARNSGLSLTCDRYPYTASCTDLDAVLPSWAFEGGRAREIKRLKTERERLTGDILGEHPDESVWDSIIIASVGLERNKWMEGRSLYKISRSMDRPPLDVLFDVLVEEELNVSAIFFMMNEDNLRAILRQPYTVIGTDSAARSFDGITAGGKPHPRGFGSFPRILGKFVREEKVLSLGGAVYKMTGLPADIFGLRERGLLVEGNYADIVVFDPQTINDTADYHNPFQRAAGIHYVFVNGTPIVFEGETTGALPGQILR